MRKTIVVLCAAALGGLGLAACGGVETNRDETAHRAVPTYYVKNYIERQEFNRRLETTDDPSTVLFCTAFPFNAEPYTVPIAGKLVSGGKRPDPLNQYETDHGGTVAENPDAQGMYGETVPYRFGFTPGGVYVDFTDIPTLCTTQAVDFKKTATGRVAVVNVAMTQAGQEAEQALRAGIQHNASGQFSGYTPAAQQKAQQILDKATGKQ